MVASSKKANAMNSSTDSGVAGRMIVPDTLFYAVQMVPAGRQDAAAAVVRALPVRQLETFL
jgi:hypothetical protein